MRVRKCLKWKLILSHILSSSQFFLWHTHTMLLWYTIFNKKWDNLLTVRFLNFLKYHLECGIIRIGYFVWDIPELWISSVISEIYFNDHAFTVSLVCRILSCSIAAFWWNLPITLIAMSWENQIGQSKALYTSLWLWRHLSTSNYFCWKNNTSIHTHRTNPNQHQNYI